MTTYQLLQVIWFALWGLLWAIYFGLDGFDLGSGMLAGLSRDKQERDTLIGTLAPIWDGNEVWVITAGGVTFAAFPKLYAVMFSTLYLPLILILLGLVLRAVAIEFYHHMAYNPGWQNFWAKILSVASLVVALLFGVAFGNIFAGLPFDASGWKGNVILSLLTPYGILTGLLFVSAFVMNGFSWFAHKVADDALRQKAMENAKKMWIVTLILGVLFYGLMPVMTPLMQNYKDLPVLFVVPLISVAMLLLARTSMGKGRPLAAMIYGSLTVFFAVITGVIGMFPNMLPSRLDPDLSLTAFNASSSQYTLTFMLIVVLIFLPFVLLYQGWNLKLFGQGKTGSEAGHY
ncbi:MAG TPA: cytochrome d ubiquinol oxidase subunit II [Symbiobacteriaceae bacterium]